MKNVIEKFEMVSTKYGRKVVAITNVGTYFLPPRYALIVKRWKPNVEDINCDGLFMIFEAEWDDDFCSPILKFVRE